MKDGYAKEREKRERGRDGESRHVYESEIKFEGKGI